MATNWEELLFLGEENFEELPDKAVERFTEHVLAAAYRYVPVEKRFVKKTTHPWLNDRC